jgi:hypothetical protein
MTIGTAAATMHRCSGCARMITIWFWGHHVGGPSSGPEHEHENALDQEKCSEEPHAPRGQATIHRHMYANSPTPKLDVPHFSKID